MAKIELNPTFDEFHGSLNKVTYRMAYGKVVASVKAKKTNIEPSPAQIAHQQRFSAAAAYGKIVMADPDALAVYQQGAKERNTPLFAFIMTDFLNPPSISDIDVSDYHGHIDDVVKVQVSDDFGVVKVHVAITNTQNGTIVESGEAVETGPNSGLWLYKATAAVSAGATVTFDVAASDRPGGTALDTQTKSL